MNNTHITFFERQNNLIELLEKIDSDSAILANLTISASNNGIAGSVVLNRKVDFIPSSSAKPEAKLTATDFVIIVINKKISARDLLEVVRLIKNKNLKIASLRRLTSDDATADGIRCAYEIGLKGSIELADLRTAFREVSSKTGCDICVFFL